MWSQSNRIARECCAAAEKNAIQSKNSSCRGSLSARSSPNGDMLAAIHRETRRFLHDFAAARSHFIARRFACDAKCRGPALRRNHS
jgi:hypothetical protein